MSSYPPDTTVATGAGTGGTGNLRRNLLIAGLVVALAVVATLIGAETYYRKHYADCIAAQTEHDLGSKVSVHFGAKPLLLTAIDHKVGSVTMDSDDAKFGPAVGMKVHATINDVAVVDGGANVGHSSADVTWTDDGIQQTLNGMVSDVKSSASDGMLTVKVLGGLADLQLKPQIVGNQIQVTTASASLLGIGLPTDLVSGIVDLMTQSLQTYPLDMHPTSVQVTDNGLAVRLAGGATKLAANQNTTMRC
ncbi:DUF2993 domain-containing protein [Nocardia sp. alder85J]|uniref:LmeA family phospholipid-binding protein n=1 Tax=Nocardia sp. alder85J TaxID=2862949 RepID=UPI001CD2234B|nr:DUF2993 domain-containing protein [Nocardia sp. alder85J]MCX4098814.1 DUF2993 domain-containing protein [Nocardia sp. alder85J]